MLWSLILVSLKRINPSSITTICKTMNEENAELIVDRRDNILVLTISNPTLRNALGPSIYEAGIDLLRTTRDDKTINAIILTGADGHFCGGGNLHRLNKTREGPTSVQFDGISRFHTWIEMIRDYPKPIIAAVEGACAGGGFSLALACDLIVAAGDAKFVMSYIKVGLTPDGGGSFALANLVPRQLALELLLDAQAITTQRLHQFGVVNRVTAPAGALDAALQWAQKLSAGPQRATERIKQLLRAAPQNNISAQMALERDSFVTSLFDAECGEGIAAFFEKRSPNFRGSGSQT
jgi:enoyl-CoA hydratase/carnithine racemase